MSLNASANIRIKNNNAQVDWEIFYSDSLDFLIGQKARIFYQNPDHMNAHSPSESSRVALRPVIPNLAPAQSPAEQFQNETLRPILKMQNDLIVQLYRHFLVKRKVKFDGMSIEERKTWISKSVSKDNRLRGILLGMVVGQFTDPELATFIDMEGEARRRIFDLVTQRLQSQMKALL